MAKPNEIADYIFVNTLDEKRFNGKLFEDGRKFHEPILKLENVAFLGEQIFERVVPMNGISKDEDTGENTLRPGEWLDPNIIRAKDIIQVIDLLDHNQASKEKNKVTGWTDRETAENLNDAIEGKPPKLKATVETKGAGVAPEGEVDSTLVTTATGPYTTKFKTGIFASDTLMNKKMFECVGPEESFSTEVDNMISTVKNNIGEDKPIEKTPINSCTKFINSSITHAVVRTPQIKLHGRIKVGNDYTNKYYQDHTFAHTNPSNLRENTSPEEITTMIMTGFNLLGLAEYVHHEVPSIVDANGGVRWPIFNQHIKYERTSKQENNSGTSENTVNLENDNCVKLYGNLCINVPAYRTHKGELVKLIESIECYAIFRSAQYIKEKKRDQEVKCTYIDKDGEKKEKGEDSLKETIEAEFEQEEPSLVKLKFKIVKDEFTTQYDGMMYKLECAVPGKFQRGSFGDKSSGNDTYNEREEPLEHDCVPSTSNSTENLEMYEEWFAGFLPYAILKFKPHTEL